MGAESDVGGGSGKTLQSHGQLPPGKMRIGCDVELGSAPTRALLGECPPKRTAMSTSFFESSSIDRCCQMLAVARFLGSRKSDSPITYPLSFLTAPGPR